MHIHDTITINRSVAEVWAFLQQPNSEALWHASVLEEKLTSEGGLRGGATGVEVRTVFGRQMEFPWEITRYEPERKVTTASRGGPVAWEATYVLEPAGEGTRFVFDYRQEATGIWKLLLLGAPWVMRKQAQTDLARLKSAVEAGARPDR